MAEYPCQGLRQTSLKGCPKPSLSSQVKRKQGSEGLDRMNRRIFQRENVLHGVLKAMDFKIDG